ncbi:MAG: hypothetical protein RL341_942 [Pseudomonadota bacterium]
MKSSVRAEPVEAYLQVFDLTQLFANAFRQAGRERT